jgi:hypothetical protein
MLGLPFKTVFNAFQSGKLAPHTVTKSGVPLWDSARAGEVAAQFGVSSDKPATAPMASTNAPAPKPAAKWESLPEPARAEFGGSKTAFNVYNRALATGKIVAPIAPEFFDFRPITSSSKAVIHTKATLAKFLGATEVKVAFLLASGRLPIMRADGDRFMFAIDDLNALSKHDKKP